MARVPTTLELTEQYVAGFESALNQNVPAVDQAYNKVVAAQEAMVAIGQYLRIAERAQQNLVKSATGVDLTRLGEQHGVIQKPAEAAVLNVYQIVAIGTTVPATVSYVGDSNNVVYTPDNENESIGGFVVQTLTAATLGVVGDIAIGGTLQMSSEIAGVASLAQVIAIENEGFDGETEDAYKERILTEIRTPGGGSTAADYRKWAEETPEVLHAYPYAGGLEDVPIFGFFEYSYLTPAVEAAFIAYFIGFTEGQTVVYADIETAVDAAFGGPVSFVIGIEGSLISGTDNIPIPTGSVAVFGLVAQGGPS